MMIFTVSIIVLLLFQHFAIAQDDSNKNTEISWYYPNMIGIIVGTVIITIIFTCFTFLTLRYMKKKFSRPVYYVDDVPIEKDGNEYYIENTNVQINQIQPILTVSEVVSSMKQALENLGNTVLPQRWSSTQEKTDILI